MCKLCYFMVLQDSSNTNALRGVYSTLTLSEVDLLHSTGARSLVVLRRVQVISSLQVVPDSILVTL